MQKIVRISREFPYKEIFMTFLTTFLPGSKFKQPDSHFPPLNRNTARIEMHSRRKSIAQRLRELSQIAKYG